MRYRIIIKTINFRKSTNDIDYSNPLLPFVEQAIEKTANKHKLFKDWLNNEFRKTTSYSDKINDVSIFYKKISDIVEVRTVSPEYLIAMKLMAFRDMDILDHKTLLNKVINIIDDRLEKYDNIFQDKKK